MKLSLYTKLIGSLAIIALIACSKGGDGGDNGGGPHVVVPNDTTAPGIAIFTPADDQVFSNGNTINVTGKVTDDYGLYRGTIRIVNDATGGVLLQQPYDIHAILSYNFNINHTATASSPSNYTVTVTFEDHGNNISSKSVKIKVNP